MDMSRDICKKMTMFVSVGLNSIPHLHNTEVDEEQNIVYRYKQKVMRVII
jgi:hypothetical protein